MEIMSRKMYESGELQKRVDAGLEQLESCCLCPRNCGVNRLAGEIGVCKTGRLAKIASYGPHFGEERVLVGNNGSGTIFFASCNLLCSFCQNRQISHFPENEREYSAAELANVMLELQTIGCHNINLVTPSHVSVQILEALLIACENGLDIPLVYNCGGYEGEKSLELLDGVVDIYMPDFKFWQSATAEKYCAAPDYPEIAKNCVAIMQKQVGDLQIDENGLAVQGLLLRHLLMPKMMKETEKIVDFIAESVSRNTYVNIMDQYYPCPDGEERDVPGESILPEEYEHAVEYGKKAGLSRLDTKDLSVLLQQLGLL